MRIHWIAITTLGITAAITSCKDERNVSEASAPEEIAGTLCGASFACDCENMTYQTEAECHDTEKMTLEAQFEAAKAAGLTYDGTCVGRGLDFYDGLGCGDGSDLDLEGDCSLFCAQYHGDVAAGGDCMQVAGTYFDDCAQGLACEDGVCRDFCGGFTGLGEGEVCAFDNTIEGCAEGLYCDIDPDGMGACVKAPTEGQPCPQGICAEDLFCTPSDTDMVCMRPLGIGQACEFGQQCETGLCQGGTCAALPGEGEPCTAACAENLFCDQGTCSAGPGEGEPCLDMFFCREGLVCDDDSQTCQPPPPLVCYLFG